jgi:hypothetical protein
VYTSVSGPRGATTSPVLHNLEIIATASKALGAAGFVDLYSLQVTDGVERAGREFARVVLACLDGRGAAT